MHTALPVASVASPGIVLYARLLPATAQIMASLGSFNEGRQGAWLTGPWYRKLSCHWSQSAVCTGPVQACCRH